MKNIGSTPAFHPTGSDQPQNPEIDQPSVIEVATGLVESVTQMLCKEITNGKLNVDDHEKPFKNREETIKIQAKTIDQDEHKRKIKKFMMMNRKCRELREKKSLQMSERSLKFVEEQERTREESRLKVLEERRKSIEKRMQEKQSMLNQIQQSVLESNKKYKSLRKKKFLYQEKEEEFYKKVILPKIEEEKNILEKKKQIRRPIDMSELYQHGRKYEQFKINESLNRSITVRMIKDRSREYSPPDFTPESFRKVQEEETLKREIEEFKRKSIEANDIRKREYSKKLEEIRMKERELSRSRSKSPVTKTEPKEKVKVKLERQQVKSMGNQYLNELIKKNRKFSTPKKFKLSDDFESSKRQVRNKYEIQIVKEERIKKIHTIRNRKIDQIVSDNKLDHHTKMERLKSEIEKLDDAATKKLQEKSDIDTANESASIMMNSIHAKLALLGYNSP